MASTEHHQELPVQEFREHAVDFACDGAHFRPPAQRHQPVEALDEHVPVAQQIEHHDGDQREIDEHRQHDRAAGLHAGQQLAADRSRASCAFSVTKSRIESKSSVSVMPNFSSRHGRDARGELREEIRDAPRDRRDFALHERDQHEEERGEQRGRSTG